MPNSSFKIAISYGFSCFYTVLVPRNKVESEYRTLGQIELSFRIASEEPLNNFNKGSSFFNLICNICQYSLQIKEFRLF